MLPGSLTMTQEAFMRSLMDKVAPVVKVKQMLKRKVGYTHEEMSITCAKLEVMEISRDNVRATADGGAEPSRGS